LIHSVYRKILFCFVGTIVWALPKVESKRGLCVPENKPNIWTMLGYYGVIYLFFALITGIGYPLAQQYAKPIAKFIFPINESNSWLKTMVVMSGMYWGTVGVFILINRNKSGDS
jgi:hypothetical protein